MNSLAKRVTAFVTVPLVKQEISKLLAGGWPSAPRAEIIVNVAIAAVVDARDSGIAISRHESDDLFDALRVRAGDVLADIQRAERERLEDELEDAERCLGFSCDADERAAVERRIVAARKALGRVTP